MHLENVSCLGGNVEVLQVQHHSVAECRIASAESENLVNHGFNSKGMFFAHIPPSYFLIDMSLEFLPTEHEIR
jgi:hypothetical protein